MDVVEEPLEETAGEVALGASDEPILETVELTKRYGRVQALAGLTLRVNRGDIYGFLGRNGAGKTTTIRVVMGITKPNGGQIRLFGEPLKPSSVRLRQRIGYVAQEQNFYGWMPPTALGRFLRGFYPTWNDAEYARHLRVMELPPHRRIRTFSGGMKAKLALAAAMAHEPGFLVLDEPTAGLDAVARREFVDVVQALGTQHDRTIFFSSHLIDEVESAAGRIGIVDQGRVLYEGPLAELSDTVRLLRVVADAGALTGGLRLDAPPSGVMPPMLLDPVAGFRILQDRVRGGERVLVVQAARPDLFGTVLTGFPGWRMERMSLEDIFIEMVRKPMVT